MNDNEPRRNGGIGAGYRLVCASCHHFIIRAGVSLYSMRLNLVRLLAITAFGANGAYATGLDVCAALPIGTVNGLVHQTLSGMRTDISEEAHSYGCAYGMGGLISVSVIRPGGAAAFSRTTGRYTNAILFAGLGDKAVFEKDVGTIALFGDMVIDAFVSRGDLSDAQLSAMEKSLILALRSHL